MVRYEWNIEEWDETDILENYYSNKLSEYPNYHIDLLSNDKCKLTLVMYDGNEDDGLQDRQYAYVTNNELPLEFDGGRKVPNKYSEELKRFFK